MESALDILSKIHGALREARVSFREVHHEPTFTSAESAKARGEDLNVGAKALLLRVDEQFAIFVLPADRQLDSGAVKRHMARNASVLRRRKNCSS